ncbi:hypothetical protein P43SY_006910 [Pythium insidiosum]|uniref:Histidine acid phosphatase n=1 Tax=Pythium insidiosum TaxID=114742 RepID=A0AAD5M956_PYTIN|nr:hypothetical protein P43SY_006910 [Pythium insidiosum]
MRLATSTLALLVAALAAPAQSELRRLVTLSRHGSRAPNDVVHALCPNNNGNLAKYHVPVEQLTEFGMQQLVAVGEHIRKVYVEEKKFLSPTFNGVNHTHFESYFRSDAATRCSQSATALAYGLYPDGTGPEGFPRQPVPVYMQLLPNEHDFAAPKGPCKATLKADLAAYAKTRAPVLLEEYKDTLERVSELCGANLLEAPTIPGGEDVVLAVKDVADMFIFDRQERLPPLAGLTPEVSGRLEQLAFTNLMERYYTTDRMITYWNGGFPDLLLGNLYGAANPSSPAPKQYRYYSYHGHRELLHGLGKMLGWNLSFAGEPSALGMTSLHPGTTMFFELHAEKNDTSEQYFVKTFVWSPKTPREAVKLSKCSALECPLDEFNAIIKNHVARTGTWQDICNYHPAPAASTEATLKQVDNSSTQAAEGSETGTAFLIVISALLGLGLIFGILQAVIRMRNFRRQGYTSI